MKVWLQQLSDQWSYENVFNLIKNQWRDQDACAAF